MDPHPAVSSNHDHMCAYPHPSWIHTLPSLRVTFTCQRTHTGHGSTPCHLHASRPLCGAHTGRGSTPCRLVTFSPPLWGPHCSDGSHPAASESHDHCAAPTLAWIHWALSSLRFTTTAGVLPFDMDPHPPVSLSRAHCAGAHTGREVTPSPV
jgi:hypothetical protein